MTAGAVGVRASSEASDPELLAYGALSDEELWKYVAKSDRLVNVGLKGPDMAAGVVGGQIVASEAVEAAAKKVVLAVDGVELTYEDDLFPQVGLRVRDLDALKRVRSLSVIDYIEPASLLLPDKAGTAWMDWSCGYDDYTSSLYTVPQGDKLSSRIGRDIQAAWSRSTGAGVTISFVGTGVSSSQPQLNADFTSGQSSGRTIKKAYREASPSSFPWNDDCGHETKLIANAAAPLDGLGVAGIAYKANVFSVRSDNDTHLTEDSYNIQLGIRDAVAEGKIVNMSFGSTDTKTNIKNEIIYWYTNGYAGQQRMFVGAAGTSTFATNHIMMFPSNLTEVVGVTGTDPNDGACNARCHYDPKVEFGLPTYEPTVKGSGYGIGQGGGSSHATSTFSAMAALVWARFPTETRAQVVDRLAKASPYHPNLGGSGKRTDTGWATPRINCALGGLCGAKVNGPSTVNPGTNYTFTVSQLGNNVPATYTWTVSGGTIVGSTTGTSFTARFVASTTSSFATVQVTVRDQVSGLTYTVPRSVYVNGSCLAQSNIC